MGSRGFSEGMNLTVVPRHHGGPRLVCDRCHRSIESALSALRSKVCASRLANVFGTPLLGELNMRTFGTPLLGELNIRKFALSLSFESSGLHVAPLYVGND